MNKQEKTERRTFIRALERMGVVDGDLILIKNQSRPHMILNKLATALGEHGKPNCILLVVDDFSDIQIANPEVMETNGWVQIEKGTNDEPLL